MIQPYFTKDNNPELFTRSAVKYQSINAKEVLDRHPSEQAKSLINLAQELDTGAFIAGGAVLSLFSGKPINDIDLYFSGPEAFEATLKLFMDTGKYVEDKQAHLIHLKPLGKGLPVQLMNLAWFNDARHVIDIFDYTVCQFALHGETIWMNPVSLMDLMKKQIRMHRFLPQAKPLQRLQKYARKGFWAPPETVEAIENYIRNPPTARQPIPYNLPPPMIGLSETIRHSEEEATLRPQEVAWTPDGILMATQGPLPEGTLVCNGGIEPYVLDRHAANPCEGTPTLWVPQTTSDQGMVDVYNLNRRFVTVRRFVTAGQELTAATATTTAADDSQRTLAWPPCRSGDCMFDYLHPGPCSDGQRVGEPWAHHMVVPPFDRPIAPLIVSPRVMSALNNLHSGSPNIQPASNSYPVPDRTQALNAVITIGSTTGSPLVIEPISLDSMSNITHHDPTSVEGA